MYNTLRIKKKKREERDFMRVNSEYTWDFFGFLGVTVLVIIVFAVILWAADGGDASNYECSIVESTVVSKNTEIRGKVTHHKINIESELDDNKYSIIVPSSLYNEIEVGDSIFCKAYINEANRIDYMKIADDKDLFSAEIEE